MYTLPYMITCKFDMSPLFSVYILILCSRLSRYNGKWFDPLKSFLYLFVISAVKRRERQKRRRCFRNAGAFKNLYNCYKRNPPNESQTEFFNYVVLQRTK